MPTSRKRAKGKERKLKQQARKSDSSSSPPPAVGGDMISLPEQNIQRVERAKRHIKCLHGGSMITKGHPVKDFIRTFEKVCVLENGTINMMQAMVKTFDKHEDIWRDSTLRKMVIDFFLFIGTNFLLEDFYIAGARKNSEAVIFLEHYDGYDTFPKASEDYYYMLGATDREVVYFYKKRIPCSCLDDLYSKIKKSQVRGSTCFHCNQITKRKDLKTCNSCKCAQYCSKECQALAWPSHKELCKDICPFHESA